MLYKKTPEAEEMLKKLRESEDGTDFEKIRCPLCDWRPTAESRWVCAEADAPEYFYDPCRTSWNTFETRGRCPGCAHQWRWTSCLACWQWSRHEDWYEKKTA